MRQPCLPVLKEWLYVGGEACPLTCLSSRPPKLCDCPSSLFHFHLLLAVEGVRRTVSVPKGLLQPRCWLTGSQALGQLFTYANTRSSVGPRAGSPGGLDVAPGCHWKISEPQKSVSAHFLETRVRDSTEMASTGLRSLRAARQQEAP